MKKIIYKYVVLTIILLGTGLILSSVYEIINAKYQMKKSIYNIESTLKKGNKDKSKDDNKNIENNEFIGVLTLGKNNIKIPIIEGTSEESLKKGAGHLGGSGMPPNKDECFLFGHRDTVFSHLQYIKKNDLLTLKNCTGEYKYKVIYTKVTEINKNEILKKYGDNTLILVTCYPFRYIGSAPKRYIVVCSLEK
ncbi:sortase [Clostridium novyi A str. 4552]|uniref:Sortase n=1 Tax=Clostridium novyi A str. 4552 TaxID=1444289 RepID=A0A0A0I5T2_CLONO|nr:class D sortase [Clostridium novyi]KGM96187.1 sortase [Clostridium novyi A str. 4552]